MKIEKMNVSFFIYAILIVALVAACTPFPQDSAEAFAIRSKALARSTEDAIKAQERIVALQERKAIEQKLIDERATNTTWLIRALTAFLVMGGIIVLGVVGGIGYSFVSSFHLYSMTKAGLITEAKSGKYPLIRTSVKMVNPNTLAVIDTGKDHEAIIVAQPMAIERKNKTNG